MKCTFSNLAFFVALIIFSGCAATANYGSNSEANKTQTSSFESTFDLVYTAAIQVAAQQNWSVKNSDKDAGYFRAETPGSMGAWSDEVNVTIVENNGLIEVTVKSNLGQKPNRDIVSKYLTTLEEKLKL